MKSALLVVDVQQFYLNDIPADLPQRIRNHYESVPYDLIAFGVFQNTAQSNLNHSLKWDKCSTEADTKLPDEFQDLAGANNVFKRDCYSVFANLGLNDYLRQNDVSRLVICGVDSHACVLATAFAAFDLGYHVKVEFSISYSSAGLEEAARQIVEESILSRD